MEKCLLCLEATSQLKIVIFSDEGLLLNISNIIAKHFWFKPNIDIFDGHHICLSCWELVRDFHLFYLRVAKAHKFLGNHVLTVLETDPLPTLEALPKVEELESTELLLKPLDNGLINPEVKLEVNELDLLPRVEIFEETLNPVVRTARGGRRGRSTVNTKTSSKKRIKRELTPQSNSDSETELPLAMLMNISCKTDVDNDPTSICERVNIAVREDAVTTEPRQKRRGRPRKVKDKELPKKEKGISANVDITPGSIKIEHADGGESDEPDGREFLACGLISGTDDESADSNSSESGDSDASWLNKNKPRECYAVIPKRVCVKPKKYRKREKPLVPIKHMSREEIDARNAQQAEYDATITKFYEEIPCPKCSLLVKNFSDLKAHFRVSHNDDHGYMMCCGRRYYLRKLLAEHVHVHWNPEHFKCSTCSQILQDSRSLEQHEQAHINPPEPKEKRTKSFMCDKCPKSFTTKLTYEEHIISKHVPKSEYIFECPECNQKQPTKRKLKEHINYMHNPESAIICDKCGKRMRTEHSLKKHHSIFHSDVPRPVSAPVQCKICSTWLRNESALKTHTRTIHEEYGGDYRCPICNKASVNSRALRRHIHLNHELERKYKCTMCEKAFKRPQCLREHISTHTGEVLYTCPNCPMTFFCAANMYTHRKRLHRALWEADRKKPYYPPLNRKKPKGCTSDISKEQPAVATIDTFIDNNRDTTSTMREQVHNLS